MSLASLRSRFAKSEFTYEDDVPAPAAAANKGISEKSSQSLLSRFGIGKSEFTYEDDVPAQAAITKGSVEKSSQNLLSRFGFGKSEFTYEDDVPAPAANNKGNLEKSTQNFFSRFGKSEFTYEDDVPAANTDKGKSGNVLGVEFAPILSIPWERRMQTVAVFTWITTFFLMGPLSTLFLLYLFLFTRYGFISLFYLAWLLYDIDICNHGGRRWNWVRNWKIWKRYQAYFPIQLVKTAELDPSKNYLFGSHPHGILCSGAFCNFATEANNFSQVFPGITPHLLTLEGHYSMPIYREYLMCSGTCSASKTSLNYLMSKPEGGNAAILVVGGAPEALDSHPGSYCLQLNRRKGFIKTAIRLGAALVPVFSFGETDIYDQVNNPEGSMLRSFQNKLQKLGGVAPVLLIGRGFFQYSFGIIPQRQPITTVVGAPIAVQKSVEPSQQEIDDLHAKYVSALKELFYTHRDKYASPDSELKFV